MLDPVPSYICRERGEPIRAITLQHMESEMKKTIAVIPVVLALAAASPALARAHHHYRSDPAPYSHIDSGWGPPTNWNDIEISHPEGAQS